MHLTVNEDGHELEELVHVVGAEGLERVLPLDAPFWALMCHPHLCSPALFVIGISIRVGVAMMKLGSHICTPVIFAVAEPDLTWVFPHWAPLCLSSPLPHI